MSVVNANVPAPLQSSIFNPIENESQICVNASFIKREDHRSILVEETLTECSGNIS